MAVTAASLTLHAGGASGVAYQLEAEGAGAAVASEAEAAGILSRVRQFFASFRAAGEDLLGAQGGGAAEGPLDTGQEPAGPRVRVSLVDAGTMRERLRTQRATLGAHATLLDADARSLLLRSDERLYQQQGRTLHYRAGYSAMGQAPAEVPAGAARERHSVHKTAAHVLVLRGLQAHEVGAEMAKQLAMAYLYLHDLESAPALVQAGFTELLCYLWLRGELRRCEEEAAAASAQLDKVRATAAEVNAELGVIEQSVRDALREREEANAAEVHAKKKLREATDAERYGWPGARRKMEAALQAERDAVRELAEAEEAENAVLGDLLPQAEARRTKLAEHERAETARHAFAQRHAALFRMYVLAQENNPHSLYGAGLREALVGLAAVDGELPTLLAFLRRNRRFPTPRAKTPAELLEAAEAQRRAEAAADAEASAARNRLLRDQMGAITRRLRSAPLGAPGALPALLYETNPRRRGAAGGGGADESYEERVLGELQDALVRANVQSGARGLSSEQLREFCALEVRSEHDQGFCLAAGQEALQTAKDRRTAGDLVGCKRELLRSRAALQHAGEEGEKLTFGLDRLEKVVNQEIAKLDTARSFHSQAAAAADKGDLDGFHNLLDQALQLYEECGEAAEREDMLPALFELKEKVAEHEMQLRTMNTAIKEVVAALEADRLEDAARNIARAVNVAPEAGPAGAARSEEVAQLLGKVLMKLKGRVRMGEAEAREELAGQRLSKVAKEMDDIWEACRLAAVAKGILAPDADRAPGPSKAKLSEAQEFESIVTSLSLELEGSQKQREAMSQLDMATELKTLPELEQELAAHLEKASAALELLWKAQDCLKRSGTSESLEKIEAFLAISLELAIRCKDAPKAKELLAASTSLASGRAVDGGMPFLCSAAAADNPGAIELLVAAGVDVNMRDTKKASAMHYAVRHCSAAALKELARTPRINANIKDGDDLTPLHLAVSAGKVKEENKLRRAWGLNQRRRDPNFLALTADAVQSNRHKRNEEMVAVLLQDFAKINPNVTTGPHARTCLHLACDVGFIRAAELLLRHPQIDANLVDKRDRSALVSAIWNRRDITVLVQSVKVDLNRTMPDKGWTPLHVAIVKGNDAALAVLLAAGDDRVNLNLEDHMGWTPMSHALHDGNLLARKRLLHAYKSNPTGLQTCVLYSSAMSMVATVDPSRMGLFELCSPSALRKLPRHLTATRQWEALRDTLCNLAFLSEVTSNFGVRKALDQLDRAVVAVEQWPGVHTSLVRDLRENRAALGEAEVELRSGQAELVDVALAKNLFGVKPVRERVASMADRMLQLIRASPHSSELPVGAALLQFLSMRPAIQRMDHLGYGRTAPEFGLALRKSEEFVHPELLSLYFFEEAARNVAEQAPLSALPWACSADRGAAQQAAQRAAQHTAVGRLAALLSLSRGQHETRDLLRIELERAVPDEDIPALRSALCSLLYEICSKPASVFITVPRVYRASESSSVAIVAICTPLFSIPNEDDAIEVRKLVEKACSLFQKGDNRLQPLIQGWGVSAIVSTTPSVFLAFEICAPAAVTARLGAAEEFGAQVALDVLACCNVRPPSLRVARISPTCSRVLLEFLPETSPNLAAKAREYHTDKMAAQVARVLEQVGSRTSLLAKGVVTTSVVSASSHVSVVPPPWRGEWRECSVHVTSATTDMCNEVAHLQHLLLPALGYLASNRHVALTPVLEALNPGTTPRFRQLLGVSARNRAVTGGSGAAELSVSLTLVGHRLEDPPFRSAFPGRPRLPIMPTFAPTSSSAFGPAGSSSSPAVTRAPSVARAPSVSLARAPSTVPSPARLTSSALAGVEAPQAAAPPALARRGSVSGSFRIVHQASTADEAVAGLEQRPGLGELRARALQCPHAYEALVMVRDRRSDEELEAVLPQPARRVMLDAQPSASSEALLWEEEAAADTAAFKRDMQANAAARCTPYSVRVGATAYCHDTSALLARLQETAEAVERVRAHLGLLLGRQARADEPDLRCKAAARRLEALAREFEQTHAVLRQELARLGAEPPRALIELEESSVVADFILAPQGLAGSTGPAGLWTLGRQLSAPPPAVAEHSEAPDASGTSGAEASDAVAPAAEAETASESDATLEAALGEGRFNGLVGSGVQVQVAQGMVLAGLAVVRLMDLAVPAAVMEAPFHDHLAEREDQQALMRHAAGAFCAPEGEPRSSALSELLGSIQQHCVAAVGRGAKAPARAVVAAGGPGRRDALVGTAKGELHAAELPAILAVGGGRLSGKTTLLAAAATSLAGDARPRQALNVLVYHTRPRSFVSLLEFVAFEVALQTRGALGFEEHTPPGGTVDEALSRLKEELDAALAARASVLLLLDDLDEQQQVAFSRIVLACRRSQSRPGAPPAAIQVVFTTDSPEKLLKAIAHAGVGGGDAAGGGVKVVALKGLSRVEQAVAFSAALASHPCGREGAWSDERLLAAVHGKQEADSVSYLKILALNVALDADDSLNPAEMVAAAPSTLASLWRGAVVPRAAIAAGLLPEDVETALRVLAGDPYGLSLRLWHEAVLERAPPVAGEGRVTPTHLRLLAALLAPLFLPRLSAGDNFALALPSLVPLLGSDAQLRAGLESSHFFDDQGGADPDGFMGGETVSHLHPTITMKLGDMSQAWQEIFLKRFVRPLVASVAPDILASLESDLAAALARTASSAAPTPRRPGSPSGPSAHAFTVQRRASISEGEGSGALVGLIEDAVAGLLTADETIASDLPAPLPRSTSAAASRRGSVTLAPAVLEREESREAGELLARLGSDESVASVTGSSALLRALQPGGVAARGAGARRGSVSSVASAEGDSEAAVERSPLERMAGLMDEWRKVIDPLLWTARYAPPARHLTVDEAEVEYTVCARLLTAVDGALEDLLRPAAQAVLATVELAVFAWVAEHAPPPEPPADTSASARHVGAETERLEEQGSTEAVTAGAWSPYTVPPDLGDREGGCTLWVFDVLSGILADNPMGNLHHHKGSSRHIIQSLSARSNKKPGRHSDHGQHTPNGGGDATLHAHQPPLMQQLRKLHGAETGDSAVLDAAAALDDIPKDVLAWFKFTGAHLELKALHGTLEANSEKLMAIMSDSYRAMWLERSLSPADVRKLLLRKIDDVAISFKAEVDVRVLGAEVGAKHGKSTRGGLPDYEAAAWRSVTPKQVRTVAEQLEDALALYDAPLVQVARRVSSEKLDEARQALEAALAAKDPHAGWRALRAARACGYENGLVHEGSDPKQAKAMAALEQQLNEATAELVTDVEKSVAFGPGLEGGEAGVPQLIVIRARNSLGRNIAGGGESELWNVQVLGPKGGQSVPVTLRDQRDGSYHARFFPPHPGRYLVSITHRHPVLDTPLPLFKDPCAVQFDFKLPWTQDFVSGLPRRLPYSAKLSTVNENDLLVVEPTSQALMLLVRLPGSAWSCHQLALCGDLQDPERVQALVQVAPNVLLATCVPSGRECAQHILELEAFRLTIDRSTASIRAEALSLEHYAVPAELLAPAESKTADEDDETEASLAAQIQSLRCARAEGALQTVLVGERPLQVVRRPRIESPGGWAWDEAVAKDASGQKQGSKDQAQQGGMPVSAVLEEEDCPRPAKEPKTAGAAAVEPTRVPLVKTRHAPPPGAKDPPILHADQLLADFRRPILRISARGTRPCELMMVRYVPDMDSWVQRSCAFMCRASHSDFAPSGENFLAVFGGVDADDVIVAAPAAAAEAESGSVVPAEGAAEQSAAASLEGVDQSIEGARVGLGAAAGDITAAGGTTVESLEWDLIHPTGEIPETRSNFRIAAVGPLVILHGGVSEDGARIFNDLYVFDFTPGLQTWTRVLQLARSSPVRATYAFGSSQLVALIPGHPSALHTLDFAALLGRDEAYSVERDSGSTSGVLALDVAGSCHRAARKMLDRLVEWSGAVKTALAGDGKGVSVTGAYKMAVYAALPRRRVDMAMEGLSELLALLGDASAMQHETDALRAQLASIAEDAKEARTHIMQQGTSTEVAGPHTLRNVFLLRSMLRAYPPAHVCPSGNVLGSPAATAAAASIRRLGEQLTEHREEMERLSQIEGLFAGEAAVATALEEIEAEETLLETYEDLWAEIRALRAFAASQALDESFVEGVVHHALEVRRKAMVNVLVRHEEARESPAGRAAVAACDGALQLAAEMRPLGLQTPTDTLLLARLLFALTGNPDFLAPPTLLAALERGALVDARAKATLAQLSSAVADGLSLNAAATALLAEHRAQLPAGDSGASPTGLVESKEAPVWIQDCSFLSAATFCRVRRARLDARQDYAARREGLAQASRARAASRAGSNAETRSGPSPVGRTASSSAPPPEGVPPLALRLAETSGASQTSSAANDGAALERVLSGGEGRRSAEPRAGGDRALQDGFDSTRAPAELRVWIEVAGDAAFRAPQEALLIHGAPAAFACLSPKRVLLRAGIGGGQTAERRQGLLVFSVGSLRGPFRLCYGPNFSHIAIILPGAAKGSTPPLMQDRTEMQLAPHPVPFDCGSYGGRYTRSDLFAELSELERHATLTAGAEALAAQDQAAADVAVHAAAAISRDAVGRPIVMDGVHRGIGMMRAVAAPHSYDAANRLVIADGAGRIAVRQFVFSSVHDPMPPDEAAYVAEAADPSGVKSALEGGGASAGEATTAEENKLANELEAVPEAGGTTVGESSLSPENAPAGTDAAQAAQVGVEPGTEDGGQ